MNVFYIVGLLLQGIRIFKQSDSCRKNGAEPLDMAVGHLSVAVDFHPDAVRGGVDENRHFTVLRGCDKEITMLGRARLDAPGILHHNAPSARPGTLALDYPKDPHGERFSYSGPFPSILIARTDKLGMLRPEAKKSD